MKTQKEKDFAAFAEKLCRLRQSSLVSDIAFTKEIITTLLHVYELGQNSIREQCELLERRLEKIEERLHHHG